MKANPQGARGWRVLPAAAALAIWCALFAMCVSGAWRAFGTAHWRWTLDPLFHDWHVVRLGWEAHADGVDPLLARDQPFNYPRFVLVAGAVGRRLPPNLVGLAMAAIFLATVVWILRPRSRLHAVFAAILICSAPVLLLIERGNLDAWVFLFTTLGLTAIASAGTRWVMTAAGAAAVMLAAVLKLYPAIVFTAGMVFWRGARRRWMAGAFAVWLLWLVASLEEVRLIMLKTHRGLEPAYGRMVAGSRYFAEILSVPAPTDGAVRVLAILMNVSLVVCIVGIVLAGIAGWRRRGRFVDLNAGDRDRALFWSGALIYAGTFLLGNNWSYRLVFLLPCVPLLWSALQCASVRTWARLTLACVTATLLGPFHLPLEWFWLQQTVMWVLGWLLMYGAVAVITKPSGTCTPEARA